MSWCIVTGVPSTEHPVVDRRVRRTRRALQDALVSLVVEQGYDNVSIEEITDRADVARPTFYAHYARKVDLLTAVFDRLMEDLQGRLDYPGGPWMTVRTAVLTELYRHAAEYRDVYRVCLSGAGGGRARDAYLEMVITSAVRNYSERVDALGVEPKVPIKVQAVMMAGAHVAVLHCWLQGELPAYSPEDLAAMVLAVQVGGLGWAQGIPPEQLEYPTLVTDRTVPEF